MDTQSGNGQTVKKFPTKLELMGIATTPADETARGLGLTPEEVISRANLTKDAGDVLFKFSDEEKKEDVVNHPSHYTHYKGLEVIDLTEQMNFNRGNAVKYIARAGLKDKTKEIEDLKKAAWYIQREIERLRGVEETDPIAMMQPSRSSVYPICRICTFQLKVEPLGLVCENRHGKIVTGAGWTNYPCGDCGGFFVTTDLAELQQISCDNDNYHRVAKLFQS